VLDAGLRVIGANRAFYQAFRVLPEDTQQRLIYELGGGAWNIPRLRELLEGVLERDSYVENFEVEHDFPGIGRKIMSLNARKMSSGNGTGALPILLVIEDITARKQAEAERHWIEGELRQAQKMESVGTLAAGIAHDFNNSLNIIQGYAVILRDLGASNDLIAESVAAILDASQRAATIVQQLLTLARKTEPKLELINMDSLIDELAGLLRQTLPKTIELDLDVGRCLPPILADRNQMTQALLNLCINARDAMPEGGNLMLQTAVVNREDLPNRDELTEEKYVRVDIRDTGMGIDENVMGRIFEPFFTTKGAGRGTGLGLAVVYGVVKHHKGCILVTSKPMEGSCFRVYLPVHRVEQG
jgi:signal transduction histidine kinase